MELFLNRIPSEEARGKILQSRKDLEKLHEMTINEDTISMLNEIVGVTPN